MPNYKMVDADALDGAMLATAGAIRAKTGSANLVPWDKQKGFESDILAIQSGGVRPQLVVTAPEGSTITAVNGEETVTGVIGTEGSVTLDLTAFGTWTVTATLDGLEASASVYIEQEYPVELNYNTVFTVNGGSGEIVTISEDGTVLATLTLDSAGTGTVSLSGVRGKTLVFTGGTSGFTKTIDVGDAKEATVNVYPDGALYWYGHQIVPFVSSVTPTSDWAYVSPTFNSDHVLMQTTNSGTYSCPIITEDKIDISGFTTLKVLVDFTHTDYGSLNFGLTTSNAAGYESSSPAKVGSYRTDGNQQTIPCAIDSVDNTQKYYAFIHSGRIAKIKLYKMWLE